MAITVRDPNTIWLGGPKDVIENIINDFAAKEAITPGMLLDLDSTTSVNRWKKAATAKSPTTSVAKDAPMLNKGIDDNYAIGDLVEVFAGSPGTTFLAIIPSGQTIAFGDKLENAGTGKLRAWTDASQAFRALEAKTATADTRIRVEVL